jgi:hypothetical protein
MRNQGSTLLGRSYEDEVYYSTYLEAAQVAASRAVSQDIDNVYASRLYDGITFTASLSGQIGNYISLSINGTSTVQEIVDYWNTRNAPNIVTFTGRSPDYKPGYYGTIYLSGGNYATRPEHWTAFGKYNDIGPNCKYASVYCTNITEEFYVGKFAGQTIDITLIRTVSGNNFGNSGLSNIENQQIPLTVSVDADGFFEILDIPGENNTNFLYPADDSGSGLSYEIADYVYIDNAGNFKFIAGS